MKKIIKNPLVILSLGILLIGVSTATATRAAIVYQTEAERVNFSTAIFSVDLQENVDGKYVSLNDKTGLQFPEIKKDDSLKIGKKYTEDVKVVNNSNPDTGYSEYVRVVVRKSWVKDNAKQTILDPDLIKIEVADGWIKAENNDKFSKEMEVYYRATPLACGEEVPFITSVTIDSEVTSYVTNVGTESAIKNEYTYNGESANIELQADAVQTHNAKDAMYAAWGVKAEFTAEDDGNITSISPVE